MRKLYILFSLFAGLLSVAPTVSSYAQPTGNSLSYDGVNDYLALPSNIVGGITGNFAIEQWVYWRGGAGYQRIFDFGRGTNEFMFLTPSANSADTGVLFVISTTGINGAQALYRQAPLTINTWNHIAVTIEDATNTGRLFINGQLAATNTNMTLRPSALFFTNQNWLGRSEFAPDPYYNGIIDEFRISSEVRYTTNFTPQNQFVADGGTVALYHFSEGAGQTTADASANGFTGILGGTTAVETSDPTWIINGTLPINILKFAAVRSGKSVSLNWDASSTQRDGTFAIERSENGTTFQQLGVLATRVVPGTYSYSYTDAVPTGGRNYYRLKYFEAGSAARYSPTVLVNMASALDLVVFPNPVKGSAIKLKLNQPYTGELYITVTNMAGGVVYKQKVAASNSTELTIERAGSIPAGNYLLQVAGNGVNHSQKVICL
jgi:hypothetical protein